MTKRIGRAGAFRNRWARALHLMVAALLAAGGTVILSAPPAAAALTGLPAGFVDEVVVGGLPFPTGIAFSPDDRMFIALKSGIVRLHQDGQLLATPFIDMRSRVHDNHDRGLLGIAVHPEFPGTPYVYLLYTHDPPGVYPDNVDPAAPNPKSTPGRVSQLLRVEADPAAGYRVAKAGTEVVLLGTNSTRANIGQENDGRNTAWATCMNPKTMAGVPVEDCLASDEDSHTIGTVMFGPDGSLYVGNGDGSNYSGVDHRALRAQNLDSLSGKILRIDPITGAGLPDNPYYDGANPNRNRSKVWAYGVRNPFRFTVDPNPDGTGPYIGDVGWGTWEEINTGKGANFGWPCYEGGIAAGQGSEGGNTTSRRMGSYENNGATSAACAALYAQGQASVTAPVYTYDHSAGGASANAGAFYTGTTYPAQYRGALFIADYNLRWIRYLTFDAQGRATAHNFGTESSAGPVQVIAGPDTNLYWMRFAGSGGEVRRIRYVGAGNTPPTAVAAASPNIGIAPLTVNFSSDQSYDPDAQNLNYLWDFKDGTTSTERNPSHTYTASGVYDAALTVTEASAPFASTTTTKRITIGNNPPLATIEAPAPNAPYRVGDTISFSGRATAGGVSLPANAMTWELRHRHNDHFHFSQPAYGPAPGDENQSIGSWVADDHGDQTGYQMCLTATVDQTLTDTQCVDLNPLKTSFSIQSEPVGLQVQYEDEGLTLTAPAIINPIIGSTQTITVAPVQQHRTFARWSDGVTDRSRVFTVGETPGSFTAIFENQSPTAAITASSVLGAAPLTVQFGSAGSSDPEGDTLEYAWSTSDGQTATVASPSFTFAAPGTYTVTLTVADQLGATNATTTDVVALPAGSNLPPTAAIDASTLAGPAPLTVTVDGSRSADPEGQALAYAWTTSNGLSSTAVNPPFTFATPGTYTVTLTVTDPGGLTDSEAISVEARLAGLVAAYGFDEGSGSVTADRSGSANNGTLSGATWTATGKNGGALSFDGLDDRVDVADSASLDLTTGMTLSAWIQPANATTAWRTVIMKERPSNLAYALYGSGSTGGPEAWVTRTGAEVGVTSATAVPAATWHHVAATYDRTNLRVYLDGVQVGTRALTGSIGVTANPLRIGGNLSWGEYFAGLIDDVRVFNRALTPAELTTIMNTPVGPPPPADTTPPSAPGAFTATGGLGQVALSWTAATDDVGVVGYDLHRSTTAGFSPSPANRIAQPTGTSYTDAGLTPALYYYLLVARDGADNIGPAASAEGTATSDTTPPSAPGAFTATGGLGQVALSWTAATDDVGVVGYDLHRSTTAGFSPSPANRIAQPTGTSYTDAGLTPALYYYLLVARDGADNIGPAASAQGTATADTTGPTVAVTAPAAGATVAGTLALTATASDSGGVAGVQFRVDGTPVGAEDTTAPYSVNWTSTAVPNGAHAITAVARDAVGNTTTSAAVSVTVANSAITGLVAAYNFNEGSGSAVTDRSGTGNNGTVNGATWTAAGKNGGALSFDGLDDRVDVPDAASLDLTTGMTLSAWIRPASASTAWRTVIMKERPSNLAYALYGSGDRGAPEAWVTRTPPEVGVPASSAVPPATWHHLAATYDRTNLRIYLDGVQVGTRALTGSIGVSANPLRIGGNAIWGENFAGLIDDVRVFNRALTPAELTTIMNTAL